MGKALAWATPGALLKAPFGPLAGFGEAIFVAGKQAFTSPLDEDRKIERMSADRMARLATLTADSAKLTENMSFVESTVAVSIDAVIDEREAARATLELLRPVFGVPAS